LVNYEWTLPENLIKNYQFTIPNSPLIMLPTTQFSESVTANLDYWRRRVSDLEKNDSRPFAGEGQNLFRAVQFGLELPQTWQCAAELVVECWNLVKDHSFWIEWIPILEAVVAGADENIQELKAQALDQLGVLYRRNRQFDAALAAHGQEEKIGRELEDENRRAQAAIRFGETYWRMRQNDKAAKCTRAALKILLDLNADPNLVAICYHDLGSINQNRGALVKSERQLRRALQLRREHGDPLGVGRTLMNLGLTLDSAGRPEEAIACYEEAKDLFTSVSNEFELARVENCLGTLHYYQENLGAAEAAFRRADSPYMRKQGRPYDRTLTKMNLANVLLAQGRLNAAEKHWQTCIQEWRLLDSPLMLANSLSGLAETHVEQGKFEDVIPLYEEALAIVREFPDDTWAQRLRDRFENTLAELGDLSTEKNIPVSRKSG
jgi:tetratricopeptide (TPR) repeat protein